MSEKTVIDVSTWQREIEYESINKSEVDGVIIRCGVTLWGEQKMEADGMFERHYRGFEYAGIAKGAYYYSAADSVEMANREADFCISLLKGKKFEYPVYYDVENNERQGRLSKKQLTDICKAFCERLEYAGYYVGVYSNTSWFRNKLNYDELSKLYTIWLADYRGENADKQLKCDMWQYTSSGTVKGIAGNVDMNSCYRDFPEEIKRRGKNGFDCTDEKPKPDRSYTVKPGDSFWKIAADQLGDGNKYRELAAYNGMGTDEVIHPGDVLKLPN